MDSTNSNVHTIQTSEEQTLTDPSIDRSLNNANHVKSEISTSFEVSTQTCAQLDVSFDDSSLSSQLISETNDSNHRLMNEETNPNDNICSPELTSDNKSIFLFELPLIPNEVPNKLKEDFQIASELKVKLPFSKRINCIQVINGVRKMKCEAKSYWQFIENNLVQLREHLDSIKDLEKAIKSYNFNLRNTDFFELHKLSSDDKKVIPNIINLALHLPDIIPNCIPLLLQKENKTLFLSQHQISCLLANAFLCTFPETHDLCPSINFNNLFKKSVFKSKSNVRHQKLKCIINYFRRVLHEIPKGVVSFERRFLETKQIPKWNKSTKKLTKLKIFEKGTIESDGKDMLQVDFANKLVGGGVLNNGCVQEEIKFCINPELIISRLFTQKLLDEEVLIIKGTEQFNTYSGYGNSFEWDQDFKDETTIDEWGRRNTTIVAMDAIRFTEYNIFSQYDRIHLNRELNKAYCGFMDKDTNTAIATGNWGCGAFNGNKVLKFLIQLMAASECERDLNYFTFNDSSLKKELDNFYSFICDKNFQVRHLYKALQLYEGQVIKHSKSYKMDLIEFMEKSLHSIFK